jgi:hypothetical protein
MQSPNSVGWRGQSQAESHAQFSCPLDPANWGEVREGRQERGPTARPRLFQVGFPGWQGLSRSRRFQLGRFSQLDSFVLDIDTPTRTRGIFSETALHLRNFSFGFLELDSLSRCAHDVMDLHETPLGVQYYLL